MNRPLLIALILLFLAFLFLGARYISNKLCGAAPAPAAAAIAPAAVGNSCGTWAFDDGKAFRTETNRYYRFRRNFTNSVPSTRKDFVDAINGTVSYLKANADRKLRITGLYESSEKNSEISTNLGIARANDILARLTKLGVPSDQLEVDSEILRQDVVESDTLCKGAYFTFYPKANNGANGFIARSATSYIAAATAAAAPVRKASADAGKKLIGKNMIVYFETNKNNLNLSAKDKQDMRDIAAYLNAVPSARLEVSGHTDYRGDAEYNKSLSRRRARAAAAQLTEGYGISSAKMRVLGFGEERPIDNSNTPAGLAKNRRVEIILKEK